MVTQPVAVLWLLLLVIGNPCHGVKMFHDLHYLIFQVTRPDLLSDWQPKPLRPDALQSASPFPS